MLRLLFWGPHFENQGSRVEIWCMRSILAGTLPGIVKTLMYFLNGKLPVCNTKIKSTWRKEQSQWLQRSAKTFIYVHNHIPNEYVFLVLTPGKTTHKTSPLQGNHSCFLLQEILTPSEDLVLYLNLSWVNQYFISYILKCWWTCLSSSQSSAQFILESLTSSFHSRCKANIYRI